MSSEPPPAPVAPAVPVGLGTYGALTGVIGAVVAFVIAWVQDGLTPETVTLGAAAAGILAAWYGGRSIQGKAAIDKAVESYQATSTERSMQAARSAPPPSEEG